MRCGVEECVRRESCGILEILGVEPESKLKCSYFRSDKQMSRIDRVVEVVDKKKRFDNKKKKFREGGEKG
jgi:hypothetical protein